MTAPSLEFRIDPTTCDEGVVRKGEFQPCHKTAVAIRIDPEDGGYYTVCAYHSREPMVPLLDVLHAWERQKLSRASAKRATITQLSRSLRP